jgi:O-antigen ligase
MILGVLFSVHRRNSFEFVFFNYLTNILYFSFFIIFIDSVEKLRKVLYVICLSALFYAGLSILSSGQTDGRFSFGSMYDPNDLAFFLLSIFPMGFYFLSKRESALRRITAALTIAVSLTVILMTGSRGGLVGLLLVCFFLFFTRLSPLQLFHKFILLIIFVVALSMNIEKINTERFASILSPEDDYNVTNEQGRLAVWKRGWQVTLSHPLTGVGAKNFSLAIGTYRKEIGEIPRWQAPHNSFIQILTEIGFPGLIVFLFLVAGTAKTFSRISSNTSSVSCRDLIFLDRAIFLGFIGNLGTSFFLSMAYSILLTLFLALSVVLPQLYKMEEDSHPRNEEYNGNRSVEGIYEN